MKRVLLIAAALGAMFWISPVIFAFCVLMLVLTVFGVLLYRWSN